MKKEPLTFSYKGDDTAALTQRFFIIQVSKTHLSLILALDSSVHSIYIELLCDQE